MKSVDCLQMWLVRSSALADLALSQLSKQQRKKAQEKFQLPPPERIDELLSTTASPLDEGPTWAPNGRVLAFFRQDRPGGPTRLYSIDITGYNERLIVTPGEASDPAWSALIR